MPQDPSFVCEAMRTWAEAYKTPLPTDDPYKRKEREDFAAAWDKVHMAIYKSNLLYRLLYAGEKLRTEPCPIHKGRWSGCVPYPPEGCNCHSYGNLTGWKAPEADNSEVTPPIMFVTITQDGKIKE